MAFPFSMLNIAHLAAGFKSQTHVYCNVIAKAVCCPLILLSDVPLNIRYQNTEPPGQYQEFSGGKFDPGQT